MLSPPKKKHTTKYVENKVSQSGCIIAFPEMDNHDANDTLHN